MKNQYVGDVGDYGKYAMLRALSCSYSIGVNWYLTRNDDKPDGKYTTYLCKDNSDLDYELFQKLQGLLYPDGVTLRQENRCISNIESGNFMPNAVFFNEVFDYVGITGSVSRVQVTETTQNSSYIFAIIHDFEDSK